MSSRVVGAALAFAAVALFALSMFGGAWWSGHPTVDGRAIERKDVQIGLLGGSGCNNGGESRDCSSLPLSGGVSTVGIVELVTSGLSALGVGVLGLAMLRREERRKKLGKLVLGVTGLSAAVALVLAVLGPGVQASQHVSVPFGYGMFSFWLAAVGAITASLLAQRDFPPAATAQMRLPEARLLPPPSGPVPQQIDVLALLRDDNLRPAELGPEPMMGRPPPSPGGNLPGYSGPLGAPSAGGAPSGSPLFTSAPQLRPLYEMDGGSAPVATSPPRFPTRPPTPIPRANISAAAGIPTPPPFPSARPRTMPPPPGVRAKPGSTSKQTPAPHTPPPETPPPSIGRAQATITSMAVPPPPSVPAPPIMATARRAETDPVERAETELHREDETNERERQPSPDDERESKTAVERVDPGARAARVVEQAESYPVGDSTAPNVELDGLSTAEERALGDEGPTDRSRESTDDIETIALEKVSMRDLGLAPDSTSTAAHAVAEDPERPETERPETKNERPETATGVVEPKHAMSTASDSLPPPVEQPAQASGPSPACPQCESPMRWVEEHLRFYCKSCRMYF